MSALNGKTILLARPAGSTSHLADALKNLGAEIISIAVSEVKTAELTEELTAGLIKACTSDILIFTSRNGVDSFFDLIERAGITPQKNIAYAVNAAGAATALRIRGVNPDFISSGPRAQTLGDELAAGSLVKNKKVYLLLSALAPETISDSLKYCCDVNRLNIYTAEESETNSFMLIHQARREEFDLAVFTSPSSFQFYLKAAGRPSLNAVLASFGESTRTAMRQGGYEPGVHIDACAPELFAAAIAQYFTRNL